MSVVYVRIVDWAVEGMMVVLVTAEKLVHIDPYTAPGACLIYGGDGATMMSDGEF
jgi:hypothetical protein